MELANIHVLILGMGRSGISAAKLLKSRGASPILVSRGNPCSWNLAEVLKNTPSFNEDDPKVFEELSKIKYLILSPGISKEHPIVKKSIELGIKIYSEIELAYQVVMSEGNLGKIIAVTGTNGKTTVVSMLAKFFELNNLSFFLGGNIGTPFCEYPLDEKKCDYLILELSSFQLESLDQFHANVSLITNVFDNHGERYESTEDYLKAKLNILNNMGQNDHFITIDNDYIVKRLGKELRVPKSFISRDTSLLKKNLLDKYDFNKFKLIGDHNFQNLYFVEKILSLLGLSKFSFQRLIDNFRPVEHRLERIPFNKRLIINDAKSTNWAATISAITSLKDYWGEITVLIGGKLRGKNDLPSIEDSELISKTCKKIYLYGEASLLVEKLKFSNKIEVVETIDIAVESFFKEGPKGHGPLLLSPAFPSFDQFQNYEDRGRHFKSLFR